MIAVGRSDQGRVRGHNEDSFLVDPDLRLYVVADGMGGHRAGEVASRLVVETMTAFVRASQKDRHITWPYGLDPALPLETNQLKNSIHLAHQRVLAEGGHNPDFEGMGSTVVAVVISNGRAAYANVGDSRFYLLRRGTLTQLSADDSWAALMLRAGVNQASVRSHPYRNLLTLALGSNQAIEFEVRELALEAGDLLLLCSDGLHGSVGDDQIARLLADTDGDLAAKADRLIEAANEAGGPDNVTVVLARYDSNESRAMSHEGSVTSTAVQS
jgi:protein phosphatase